KAIEVFREAGGFLGGAPTPPLLGIWTISDEADTLVFLVPSTPACTAESA
ncbi:MAG: hypothetical protein ACI85S_001298, partial [Pseudohongiellaceae bacterium]